MNHFKKSIACLVALAWMPSPKAAAEELSYGIKIAGANSFAILSDKGKEVVKGVVRRESSSLLGELPPDLKTEVNSSIWNPWFGAALYMDRAFNDHIGLGTELLYSRFDATGEMSSESKLRSFSSTRTGSQLIHTIGATLLLTWYWTGAIRPDFKDDYFLGRLFGGLHAFYCIKGKTKVQLEATREGEKVPGASLNISGDIDLGDKKDRSKLGLVAGTSLEFPNGLLLEAKGMLPYNLYNQDDKELRSVVTAIHLSVGYNFAKAFN